MWFRSKILLCYHIRYYLKGRIFYIGNVYIEELSNVKFFQSDFQFQLQWRNEVRTVLFISVIISFCLFFGTNLFHRTFCLFKINIYVYKGDMINFLFQTFETINILKWKLYSFFITTKMISCYNKNYCNQWINTYLKYPWLLFAISWYNSRL